MNIDDVVIPQDSIPDDPILKYIFARQLQLMAKYEHIERKNGVIVPEEPWSLQDREVQVRIKDMFWRASEELAEALEVRDKVDFTQWRDNWHSCADTRHFFEEMADALHFFVEASIIAGVHPPVIEHECPFWGLRSEEIGRPQQPLKAETREVVLKLAQFVWDIGLAANCLKNKPWKNTEMLTDTNKMHSLMIQAWKQLGYFWDYLCCDHRDIFALYFRKAEVNKFRQETNY